MLLLHGSGDDIQGMGDMHATADVTELSALSARELALRAAITITTPMLSRLDRLSSLASIASEIESRLPQSPHLGRVQFIIADQLLTTQNEESDPLRARFRDVAIGLLEHLRVAGPDTEWGNDARKKLKAAPHQLEPMRQISPDTAATFIKSMVNKWVI